MKQELDPKETTRAKAFRLWMNSPMPMVTLTKTFDVTYLSPQNGKLYKYDRLVINIVVESIKGELCFCDIAVTDDLERFNADYIHLTKTVSQTCQDILDDEAAKVGTSAVTGTELNCIVNQYGTINDPFLAWGRYHKGWLKTTLPISFQFHHVQMDGGHVCHFLNNLQDEINRL